MCFFIMVLNNKKCFEKTRERNGDKITVIKLLKRWFSGGKRSRLGFVPQGRLGMSGFCKRADFGETGQ